MRFFAIIILSLLPLQCLGQGDITVENRNALVPSNNIKGLKEYIGHEIQSVSTSFPIEIDSLAIPNYPAYLGMSKKRKKENLAYHFSEVIQGVPGIKSVFINQYVIFSGCRVHSCPEKGWFMIDVTNNEYLAGIIHFIWNDEKWDNKPSLIIFSNKFEHLAKVPQLYIDALSYWAAEANKQYKNIRFINRNEQAKIMCSSCTPDASIYFADPHDHVVDVHSEPWSAELVPDARLVWVAPPPSDRLRDVVTNQSATARAYIVEKAWISDSTRDLIQIEFLDTGKVFEIKGIPLDYRPISDLVWIGDRYLVFDRWSQPHYGLHYVVDILKKKLILAAPFPDQLDQQNPKGQPTKECSIPGELIHWIADYCMHQAETDDFLDEEVQVCFDENEKNKGKDTCEEKKKYKMKICDHMALLGYFDGNAQTCFKDSEFIPPTVRDGGV